MRGRRRQLVALVVTSPPYFAGKEYEAALGRATFPPSYLEYLEMLRDVFAECRRVLEPGGRIAVNVANLGPQAVPVARGRRRPILQDDLGTPPAGRDHLAEGPGATGSIAVGLLPSAANPVLRDVTERVVIASKGRFDRAISRAQRERRGLPFENTISKDEFFEVTLDVWRDPARARPPCRSSGAVPGRAPGALIQFYTYRDDVVLDPFLGSGSTAVAAIRADRRYVGLRHRRRATSPSPSRGSPTNTPPDDGAWRSRPGRWSRRLRHRGLPRWDLGQATHDGHGAARVADGGLVVAQILVVALRDGPPAAHVFVLSAAAGVVAVMALGLLFRGLALGRMSVVAPLSAIGGGVLPVVWGLIRGERPSALALAGVGLASSPS